MTIRAESGPYPEGAGRTLPRPGAARAGAAVGGNGLRLGMLSFLLLNLLAAAGLAFLHLDRLGAGPAAARQEEQVLPTLGQQLAAERMAAIQARVQGERRAQKAAGEAEPRPEVAEVMPAATAPPPLPAPVPPEPAAMPAPALVPAAGPAPVVAAEHLLPTEDPALLRRRAEVLAPLAGPASPIPAPVVPSERVRALLAASAVPPPAADRRASLLALAAEMEARAWAGGGR